MPIDLTWDHNAWYHRRLLRELPDRVGEALDVGCGAGTLARRLAGRADHVDAFDRAPHMVALARALVPENVTVHEADLAAMPLPAAHYDAVTSVSVLHHLDLPTVLPQLAAALAPGGVLVAVALPRVDLPREAPLEAVAAVGHRLVGVGLRVTGLVTGRRPFGREASHDVMPIADAALTIREVRAQARAVLPGATVRRLLFWRYLLVWRKPVGRPLSSPAGWPRRRPARTAPGCPRGRRGRPWAG